MATATSLAATNANVASLQSLTASHTAQLNQLFRDGSKARKGIAMALAMALAMVDHANRSGNYSVLRDNSSTGFQINNTPAQLGQIFASLRASRIDLSNTLLLTPTYAAAPQLIQPDVFRLRGGAA